MKRDLMFALLGAIILGVLNSILSIAPYVEVKYLELLCFLCGMITCIIILSYDLKSCTNLLFRLCLFVLFYVMLFLISAYSGIMQMFDKIFNILHYSPNDNAAGLLLLLFWVVMLGTCGVVVIVNACLILKNNKKTSKIRITSVIPQRSSDFRLGWKGQYNYTKETFGSLFYVQNPLIAL